MNGARDWRHNVGAPLKGMGARAFLHRIWRDLGWKEGIVDDFRECARFSCDVPHMGFRSEEQKEKYLPKMQLEN